MLWNHQCAEIRGGGISFHRDAQEPGTVFLMMSRELEQLMDSKQHMTTTKGADSSKYYELYCVLLLTTMPTVVILAIITFICFC